MKSALYARNTTPQTVAVGSNINLGSVVRRFGNNITIDNGSVSTMGAGYYDIDAMFTILGLASGDATITLYDNNTPIASTTISVGTDYSYNVSIPAMIRNVCCNASSITAVLTGVAVTVSNASIKVEKV